MAKDKEEVQIDGLAKLTAALKANTESNKSDDVGEETHASLEKFGGDEIAGESKVDIKAAIEKNMFILQNQSSSDDEKDLAKENLNAIREGAESAESRREKQAAADKAETLLGKIASGIQSQTETYDKMMGKMGGGGLLAGLGIAAMLFLDPEYIAELITKFIERVNKIVKSIKAIFGEDDGKGGLTGIAAAWEMVKENLDLIGVGILFLARKFLIGGAIKAIGFAMNALKLKLLEVGKSLLSAAKGGLTRVLGFLSKAFMTFRAFMTTSFIPAIVSTLTGAMATMAPILVAAAPIIAAAAALALIMYSISEAFESAADVWEDTGSIWETLSTFMSEFMGNLIGFIPDLLKDGIAWVAGALGFDKVEALLNSFSFTEMIGDFYKSVLDSIKEGFNFIKDKFFAALSGMFAMFEDIGIPVGDIMNKVNDFMKSILASILPKPDSNAPWYSISNLASKAIPDSVYEYAGIDPDTGATVEEVETEEVSTTKPKSLKEDFMSGTKGDAADVTPEQKQQIRADMGGTQEVSTTKRKSLKDDFMSGSKGDFTSGTKGDAADVTPEQKRQIRAQMAGDNNDSKSGFWAKEPGIVPPLDSAEKPKRKSLKDDFMSGTKGDAADVTPEQKRQMRAQMNGNVFVPEVAQSGADLDKMSVENDVANTSSGKPEQPTSINTVVGGSSTKHNTTIQNNTMPRLGRASQYNSSNQ